MWFFVSKKKYDELKNTAENVMIAQREALEEIVANETKAANATVLRMIRIANTALDELERQIDKLN